jgi:hypothetical protein
MSWKFWETPKPEPEPLKTSGFQAIVNHYKDGCQAIDAVEGLDEKERRFWKLDGRKWLRLRLREYWTNAK